MKRLAAGAIFLALATLPAHAADTNLKNLDKAEDTVTMYDFAGGAYPLLSSTGVVGNVALTKILPNMDHYDPVLASRILRADLMAAGMGKI